LLHKITIEELKIREDTANGEDTTARVKNLMALVRAGNLIPKKPTNSNSNSLPDCFGSWIEYIEEHRPAEHILEKDKFKDIDGIEPYIKKYVVRSLKNFVTGSRDFDPGMDLLSGDVGSDE
jgi:hypothetical protein